MLLTPAQMKPKSFQSRQTFFFTRGGCVSCLRACLGTRLLPVFRRALTVSVDSCTEIKSAPSVAYANIAEFGGRCRKVMLGVWPHACMHHSLIYLAYFHLKDDMQSCTSTPTFIPSTCSLKIHHACENVMHCQQTLCFDQFMRRFKLSNELLTVCRVKQHCKSILLGL